MLQKVRSVAGGVIFLLLCAGGALAMPASFTLEPQEEAAGSADDVVADLEAEVTAVEGETTDVTVPDEGADEENEDREDGDRAGSEKPDNHGKAVSTAAHCDLHGRAKGQLVRSVARDKSATAETAQAACDEAITSQAAAPAKPAKPARPTKPARPGRAVKPAKAPKAPAPAKAPKPAKSVAAPEVEEAPEAPAPAPAAPPAPGGPPAGKGNSKR